MPTATYEELLIETVPQVIETEAQYRQIARRFGDQTSAPAGPAGRGLRPAARTSA
jgi:hypothetical protein